MGKFHFPGTDTGHYSYNFHLRATLLKNAVARTFVRRTHPVKRILVVEDELSISNLICYNLEHAGYRVATAFDGDEALQMLESFCPHLMTLDLLLPRQSGWQVLDALRHHPRRRTAMLPIIVLSALSSPQLRDELHRSGVRYCLGKPFSVTELGLLVNTLLEERPDSAWSSPL
jgi:DNA-binding response OmpR family regulator